jgi:hypothetical protein
MVVVVVFGIVDVVVVDPDVVVDVGCVVCVTDASVGATVVAVGVAAAGRLDVVTVCPEPKVQPTINDDSAANPRVVRYLLALGVIIRRCAFRASAHPTQSGDG